MFSTGQFTPRDERLSIPIRFPENNSRISITHLHRYPTHGRANEWKEGRKRKDTSNIEIHKNICQYIFEDEEEEEKEKKDKDNRGEDVDSKLQTEKIHFGFVQDQLLEKRSMLKTWNHQRNFSRKDARIRNQWIKSDQKKIKKIEGTRRNVNFLYNHRCLHICAPFFFYPL